MVISMTSVRYAHWFPTWCTERHTASTVGAARSYGEHACSESKPAAALRFSEGSVCAEGDDVVDANMGAEDSSQLVVGTSGRCGSRERRELTLTVDVDDCPLSPVSFPERTDTPASDGGISLQGA